MLAESEKEKGVEMMEVNVSTSLQCYKGIVQTNDYSHQAVASSRHDDHYNRS